MASNESGQPFALAPNIPIEFPFSGRVNEDPNILRSSTRMVTACLSRDEQQIPDPWDLLQSSYSRDYLPTGSAGETSLKIRQVHVIPEILLSQFEGKECKCFMGLLPEIGRVWMTVDNRLFLWDFATGRDFTCFDELNEIIIDVALVKPKSGVFIPSIKLLFVVVTATELVILGASFEPSSTASTTSSDLAIHHTGLVFPTDDVNMLSVIGSKSGRIFTGGQDGHIYEFLYQAEEGWFSRKCRKLNKTASPFSLLTPTFLRLGHAGQAVASLAYDSDRNLLYALQDDSSIQAFYLGTHDDCFEKVSHLFDLYEQAARLCPNGIISKKGFKITSIQAVSKSDSAFINLIAMTSSGIKLLFTTLPRDQRAWARNQILRGRQVHPSHLELIHVRLAPEGSRQRDARRLAYVWNPNVHTAFYRSGVTIAASSISDEEDVMIASLINQSLVFSPSRYGPIEATSDILIEGKIWDIAEQSPLGIDSASSEKMVSVFSSSFLESISPVPGPTRKFLLLSNAGVYVLTKTTPIEELQRLLIDFNGNVEAEPINSFFETYGSDQACYLCVVLICTTQSSWKSLFSNPAISDGTPFTYKDPKVSASIAIWAMNALIHYGGEPKVVGTPIMGAGAGVMGNRIEFEFSNLNRGLHLYFSRIVSSFWNRPLGKYFEPGTENIMVLHAFGEFLDRNPALFSRSCPFDKHALIGSLGNRTTLASHDAQAQLEEAYLSENRSVATLRNLVKSTLELLSFLSICSDYSILETGNSIHGDFDRLEFEDLLSTHRGRDLISDLGTLLVQKQLKLKASVDSLCQILLQRCPTFFGESAVVIYQGTECLERALMTKDISDRMNALRDSLKLFLGGVSSLSLPALTDICRKYFKLAFFPATVELCLAVTAVIDPQNVALVASKNPALQMDTQQQEIVNQREAIYALAFEALKAVHGVEANLISPLVVQTIDIDELRVETLNRAASSRDELFHSRFYDWLVKEGLSSVLLQLETPFIKAYLEEKFSERLDSYKDLLWRLLAKHGRFLEAAHVLDELATSPEFQLDLGERIERLSLALGNARSGAVQTLESANYIQDLEERLDVSKLQNEILEQVLSQYGQVAEIEELNCTLYDISQLFNRFTQPMKLWECSLRILHCSAYQDHLLVHSLWKNIIDKAVSGRRFDVLAQKIAEMAKKLYPSAFAFPLSVDFVMDCVILVSLKYNQGPEWVTSTFSHAGIPLRDLIEQTVEFLRSPSPFWSRSENREYLLNVFVIFANNLLDRSPTSTPGDASWIQDKLSKLSIIIKDLLATTSAFSKITLLQERLNNPS